MKRINGDPDELRRRGWKCFLRALSLMKKAKMLGAAADRIERRKE